MANGSATIFKMFKSGADCDPVTGICTSTNGFPFSDYAIANSPVVVKNANYTITGTDFGVYTIFINQSGSAPTFTLPATLPVTGSQFSWIQIISYSGVPITLGRNGHTINGAAANLVLPVGSATLPIFVIVTADSSGYYVGVGFTNPMTSANDIMYGGTNGLPTRLPVGTTNAPLLAGTPPAYSTILYLTSLISGGVVCGTSTTQLASSALLATNQPAIGGRGSLPVNICRDLRDAHRWRDDFLEYVVRVPWQRHCDAGRKSHAQHQQPAQWRNVSVENRSGWDGL